MKKQIEKETKLISLFNNQLKYNDIRSEDKVIQKLKSILRILDIEFDKEIRLLQKDKYYDTPDNYFLNNNSSIRIREIDQKGNKTFYTTIKTQSDLSQRNDELIREETERNWPDFKSAERHINKYFNTLDTENKKVENAVEIVNNRTIIPIRTNDQSFNLCFDKYFFCISGRRSDDFYEIEIESMDSTVESKRIKQLRDVFTQIFDYSPHNKSKYKSGIDWKATGISIVNKHFILIDIVGYSKKVPFCQKANIIKLNKIIKKNLESLNIWDNTVALPIGDGAILALNENIDVIPFISQILNETGEYNRNVGIEDMKIFVRLAVHYGPIFEYPDINGSVNYAGTGINVVARIASKTDPESILVSNEFYNFMANYRECSEIFKDLKEIEVKHGEKLKVRQMVLPTI